MVLATTADDETAPTRRTRKRAQAVVRLIGVRDGNIAGTGVESSTTVLLHEQLAEHVLLLIRGETPAPGQHHFNGGPCSPP